MEHAKCSLTDYMKSYGGRRVQDSNETDIGRIKVFTHIKYCA
jgi:hypothetical protein